LYIFDNMKNELVENSNFADPEKNKVLDVLTKSRETALKRYEHHIYDTENGLGSMGWFRQITRTPAQFTPQQFAVFKAVHRWRDAVARMEDDNPTFIMPNHAIFSIARSLPEDRAALFSVTQHISPALRTRAEELIAAIAKAKNVGPDAPELNATIKRISDLKDAARDGGIEAPKATKSSVQVAQPAPVRQAAPLASQDLPPLRAASSKFWGSLWSGPSAEQRRPASTLSINLALPLPPLTAEIFADTTGLATEESIPNVEKPVYVAKEDRPPQDERTDIFVVKQLGGKRKRNMEEPAPAVSHAKDEFAAGEAEEIMLEETERDRRRREKAAHKEAKAKKKALEQQEAGQLDYADEEAFDYAAAPSVLRAREAEQQRAGGKKKREKKKDARFDPYKGMGDAPKGLPRTMKEKAGRSKTFTS
jgi:exosome complex exonuclease RRP6